MEPRGTKNHKESRKTSIEKHTKNTTLEKLVIGAFLHQKWTSFSWPKRSPNHNNPKNHQNEQKGSPGASKVTKNHDSDLPKPRKSTGNFSKKARWRVMRAAHLDIYNTKNVYLASDAFPDAPAMLIPASQQIIDLRGTVQKK